MTAPRYTRPLRLEEIAAIPDEDIDTSDMPELGDEFFRNARLVMPEDRAKTSGILRAKANALNNGKDEKEE